jgi:AraC-like DNA-binding protein
MSYACSLHSIVPWRPHADLEQWAARVGIPRHRHAHGYAALVVSGGYEETGSFGRYRACAGQVLLHRPFDSHLDRFGPAGARILSLPLPSPPAYGLGRVADPEHIVRLACKDLRAATESLFAQLTAVPAQSADWPDLLAVELLKDPTLPLHTWAERHGLARESLARGFRKVFAMTPAAFRAEARAHAAWLAIGNASAPLAQIAHERGFADQAHMTRAIGLLTGHPPSHWHRLIRFKTPAAAVS